MNNCILSINSCCKEALQVMVDKGLYVDSIVTDPPYELGFMSKSWDKTGIANDVELWKLASQVLKPGGHLLAFGATRTYHRMACAIEDAGFEIRDSVHWLYGQGFPKSLNVSKAIDKMAGVEREIVGKSNRHSGTNKNSSITDLSRHNTNSEFITSPTTDEAKQWDGWGSALKPAHEPCVLARKPLSESTIAENVLKHGTGGINVDGCRVGIDKEDDIHAKNPHTITKGGGSVSTGLYPHLYKVPQGRFPANVIHDGSEIIMEEFAKYGERKSGGGDKSRDRLGFHGGAKGCEPKMCVSSIGTAARFFYSAKASSKDRMGSKHPTVKPVSLMRYLCRLITPPGGIVLDIFAGTGTTGQAALEEGFNAVLIEREDEYFSDIQTRIGKTMECMVTSEVSKEPDLFDGIE